MTFLLVIVLVVPFLVDLVAWWLNLRALKRQSPPDDTERRDVPGLAQAIAHLDKLRRFTQTLAYTRAQIMLSAVSATVGLVVTLVFWFAGGFGALDRLVRGC